MSILTPEQAKELLESPDSVNLNAVHSISDEAASILSNTNDLSTEVARVLSTYKGTLCLNGLTSISDEASNELSKHEGILIMNNITYLSDDSCLSLSKHINELFLRGLKAASRIGLSYLTKNNKVIFNAFQIKKSECSGWDAPKMLDVPRWVPDSLMPMYRDLEIIRIDIAWMDERISGLVDVRILTISEMNEMRQIQVEFKNIARNMADYSNTIEDMAPLLPRLSMEAEGGPSMACLFMDKIQAIESSVMIMNMNFQNKLAAVLGP